MDTINFNKNLDAIANISDIAAMALTVISNNSTYSDVDEKETVITQMVKLRNMLRTNCLRNSLEQYMTIDVAMRDNSFREFIYRFVEVVYYYSPETIKFVLERTAADLSAYTDSSVADQYNTLTTPETRTYKIAEQAVSDLQIVYALILTLFTLAGPTLYKQLDTYIDDLTESKN